MHFGSAARHMVASVSTTRHMVDVDVISGGVWDEAARYTGPLKVARPGLDTRRSVVTYFCLDKRTLFDS